MSWPRPRGCRPWPRAGPAGPAGPGRLRSPRRCRAGPVKSSSRVMSPPKISGAASRHQSETWVYCSSGESGVGRSCRSSCSGSPAAGNRGRSSRRAAILVQPRGHRGRSRRGIGRRECPRTCRRGRRRCASCCRRPPAPLPDVAHAVLAEVEDDVARLALEDLADQPVGLLPGRRGPGSCELTVGAPVVLEEIEAPLGEPLGVLSSCW